MLIDSLKSDNWEDFKQRYQGCFGWLKQPENRELLVKITKVDQEKVVFDTETSSGFWAYCDQGVEFKFIPVTRGWYSDPDSGSPVLLMRVPARQFQRGISSQNTAAFVIRFGALSATHVVFNNLKAMLVNREFPYLTSPSPQRLSKYFALGSYKDAIGQDLFLLDRVVGVVHNNKIKLTHIEVKQEVEDLIRRKQLPFEVIQ